MSRPKDRIGDPNERADDRDLELSLRPRRFADFVGQRVAKEQLEIFVQAAKNRGDTLDHVLIAGPPGLGKTTLAGIIAARARRGHAHHLRAGAGAQGRRRRPAHQPAGGRRALRRRDPPPQRRRRGGPLSGDGGLRDRHHDRRGAGGAQHPHAGAAVHAHRRDHAHRAAHHAAARPLRRLAAARVLRGRGARRHRPALRRHPRRRRIDRRLRARDRRSLARHAARRQPPAASRARLRRGASRGRHRPRHLPRRPGALPGRRRGARQARPRHPAAPSPRSSTAGRWAWTRSPWPSARRPTRCMDVYEPYLIMQGFLKRTPRGRVLTRSGFAHCGLKPPARAGTLFEEV